MFSRTRDIQVRLLGEGFLSNKFYKLKKDIKFMSEYYKNYWKEKDMWYEIRFTHNMEMFKLEMEHPEEALKIKLKELGDYLEEHKDQINCYKRLYHL